MLITYGHGNIPTKITIDRSDTIYNIASYIHMTAQELCEIIQKIVDDDFSNAANNAKSSRTFFD